MPRFFSVFIILICFAVISPLAGCYADTQETVPGPVLNSKEDALARAKELLPELVKGKEKEFQIEHSSERDEVFAKTFGFSFFPQKNTWRLDWNPHTGVNEHIRIELDADDGSLFSLYYEPKISTHELSKKLLTRKEAEKIAYDFAQKYHPDKMASLKKRTLDSEVADDSSFNLD